MTEAKGVAVSFNPESFSEGGGLSLDGVIATFTECEIVMWDYMGKMSEKSPSLKVTLEFEDGESRDHYFGIASTSNDFIANDEGTGILNVSGADKGINKNTGFGVLMTSLINCAFDEDKLNENDCTLFNGMQVRFQEQPVIIGGKPAMKTSNGKEYPIMQAHVGEILVEAGASKPPAGANKANKGKATGKPAAKTAGKKKPAAKKDDAGDIEEIAETLVMALITAASDDDGDGTVPKKDVATGVMRLLKDKKDTTFNEHVGQLKELINVAFQDDFLGDDARPWTFENGVLSL